LLLTFQFPIADARPFSSQPDLRLSLPDWPEPETDINPQFVHFFGKAGECIGEPDEAWPDGLKYIMARRGIRFNRLETRHAGFPNRRFRPRCTFRRLFSDGQAVVRAEIGIAHNHSIYPLEDLTLEEILTIVREIAEVPTMVPTLNEEARLRPILAQGKHLARLYALASISRINAKHALGVQLVESADPVILVVLRPNEANLDIKVPMSDGLIAIDSTCVNGARALYCRLKTQSGIVATWILQQGTASVEQLRSLRICLGRLHAEREVLDLILKQIHRRRLLNPPSEEAANLLDRYFNERIKIVNRDTWGGMKQSEIVTAFDATQAVVRPASQAQLISRYEGGRRQVWEKIANYQEQRRATRLVHVLKAEKGAIMVDKQVNVSGTGNIVNVAEFMSDMTNTVNNYLADSDANAEVKALIKELNEEIKRVAPKADPSQVKKMGKSLEALSKEVACEEPEREWYSLSLKGITEAAQTMGDIANPVLSIVGKLVSLLLV
jgi:hypothetical protein